MNDIFWFVDSHLLQLLVVIILLSALAKHFLTDFAKWMLIFETLSDFEKLLTAPLSEWFQIVYNQTSIYIVFFFIFKNIYVWFPFKMCGLKFMSLFQYFLILIQWCLNFFFVNVIITFFKLIISHKLIRVQIII